MNDLLTVLSRWPGRRATKKRMEEQGYRIPQAYEEFMFGEIGEEYRAGTDRYWDEAALEIFGTLGGVDSTRLGGNSAVPAIIVLRFSMHCTSRRSQNLIYLYPEYWILERESFHENEFLRAIRG